MPSKPRPKEFVAARNFKHYGKVYRKGDPVTARRTINLLTRRGDRWITRAPQPAEPADTPAPADSPADQPQAPQGDE